MNARALMTWMGLGALALAWPGCADDPETSRKASQVRPAAPHTEGSSERLAPRVERLIVCGQSGRCETLNTEITGDSLLEGIYLPDSSRIDFKQCELDEHFHGGCHDEQGRVWQFNGPG